MADYPEATITANRLMAVNELRRVANILVPFLQREFKATTPQRLANATGYYKATTKSLTEARNRLPSNVSMSSTLYRSGMTITLKTSYPTSEYSCQYVSAEEEVWNIDETVLETAKSMFSLDEVLEARRVIYAAQNEIQSLKDEIAQIKHIYTPFFIR